MIPHSLFTSQHDITYDCGVTVIAYEKTLPESKLITKTQVDTDINNDDNTHFFETPRKHNNRTPEIPEETTTTTLVQAIANSHLCQMSSTTSTTSLKIPPSEK